MLRQAACLGARRLVAADTAAAAYAGTDSTEGKTLDKQMQS